MSGNVFAALSCLQGRPADSAAAELLAAGADGVQLTAGCAPAGDVAAVVRGAGHEVRTHHGYTPDRMRQRVWSDNGVLLAAADSIHPPRDRHAEMFWAAVEQGALEGIAVETMWPGWVLGTSSDISAAMDAQLALAVDISHLHIAVTAGALDATTLSALTDYERISEIHVSANDGVVDAHAAIDANTWGLRWAAERLAAGTDVIVEAYMHTLSPSQRRAQLDHVKDALT